jgi:hypothetical protein
MNLVVECGFLPFAIEAVIWIPEAVLLRVVPFLCDGLPVVRLNLVLCTTEDKANLKLPR